MSLGVPGKSHYMEESAARVTKAKVTEFSKGNLLENPR